MDFEQFLQSLTNEDFEWVVPMAIGVVIVVGSLLIAIFRGMTSGVIVALLFGGLMSVSPLLLNGLERSALAADGVGAAAPGSDLAALNSEAIEALAAALVSLNETLLAADAPLAPELAGDDAARERLRAGTRELGARLDAALAAAERSAAARETAADAIAD